MATRTRFESAADRPVFSITQICYTESRFNSPGNHGEPTARPANTARGLEEKEYSATADSPPSMARQASASTAVSSNWTLSPSHYPTSTSPNHLPPTLTHFPFTLHYHTY